MSCLWRNIPLLHRLMSAASYECNSTPKNKTLFCRIVLAVLFYNHFGFCVYCLQLISSFLVLFRLPPMAEGNQATPVRMGIAIAEEQAASHRVGSVTLPPLAGRQLSQKCKGSHVSKEVDGEKYLEPVRRKIHIFGFKFDLAPKLWRTPNWTTTMYKCC